MDIMTKAAELGEAIARSSEMERLKNAEIEMETDNTAKALMEEYKALQVELVRAAKEKRDRAEIEEIKSRLMSTQRQLNEYPVTKNYLEARNGFDRLVKTVNDVMTFKITGEEPCSPQKCGSCGGCN